MHDDHVFDNRDKRVSNSGNGASQLPTQCPTPELLAAYIDNNLTPEEQALIQAHLAKCDACRKIVELTAQGKTGVSNSYPSDSNN